MAKKKETTSTGKEKIFKIIYFRDQHKTFLTGERLMTTKTKAEKHAKEFLKNSSFANSYTITEESKDEKPRKKARIPLPEDDQIAKGEEPQ